MSGIHVRTRLGTTEREFFIDNLLVRNHFIVVMIRWTGLAPCEFEFPFPGSLTSTFLDGIHIRTRLGTPDTMLDSGRGTARAEDAQGTPTQSHISPSILVYEENTRSFRGKCSGMNAHRLLHH